MTFETLLGVAAQLAVFFIVGGAVSGILLRFARLSPRDRPGAPDGLRFQNVWIGAPERLLLAVVGFVAFSSLLMVVHIATSGWVFSSPVGPLVVGIAVVAGFLYLRWPLGLRMALPPLRDMWPVLLLAASLFVLFVLPVIEAGSSVRTGDPPWHLGWAQQILGGDRLPTGPAPELARNAYPWGLHAVMAALTQMVPGTDPLIALETLHIVIAGAIPLAAACLARRIGGAPGSGLWAAWAAALVGGWGWLQTRDATFIPSPRDARYGADLVAASPNSVYELLTPALPRELGLVVLAAGATLLLLYMRVHEVRLVFAGGAVIGLAGLVSLPMLVVGIVWVSALSLVHRGGKRRMLGYSLGAALLVLLTWLGPVVLQFVRHGGFVNITPRLGVEWSTLTALMSWGILLPLMVLGSILIARSQAPGGMPLFALITATFALLGAGIVRSEFGWDLAGNATLLHQGRFWPPLHLLAAAIAGYGVATLLSALPRFKWAIATGLVLLGIPSIVVASQGIKPLLEERTDGFEYSSPDIQDEDGFIRRASEVLGPDDVVLVLDSDRLAFRLFEFSGVRLANYDDPRLENNDLRIRYKDLAAEWDLITAEGGFQPDYVALSYDGVGTIGEQEPITTGTFNGETWALFTVEPAGMDQAF